jgi:hypothetical protein
MENQLNIERNLVLKAINHLEGLTKEPMCDTHPELEKQLMDTYWENEKYLRKARFNLDQIIDNLNFQTFNLSEFNKEAEEKIDFLGHEDAEIFKTSLELYFREELSYLIKCLNKKYSKYEWYLGVGWNCYIVYASKK